ncbi:hypothetical protein EYF80_027536 [Liparis tanakae]|uniref:Uncharacterized protein n=1 Tax=Liparis tanakae TaxID=230148 RepID=A0A4Z2HBW2_9TELE|nr:hypothetical protein EYF80_027536 [Liparis tanakae]
MVLRGSPGAPRPRDRSPPPPISFFISRVLNRILSSGVICVRVRLLLPLRALAEEDVVDEGVLQQGQEYKHKAPHEGIFGSVSRKWVLMVVMVSTVVIPGRHRSNGSLFGGAEAVLPRATLAAEAS